MGQYNIDFRPGSLDKLIGYTEDEINNIAEAVADATTVLIYGETGTGKTTLALALAERITDPASIHEANAGADGGIDDVRKLINMASRRTLSGKRRVFIIDEVHALSRQAMNALL